jgi:hypothetical protein
VGVCGWVREVGLGMAGSKSKNGKRYDHGLCYITIVVAVVGSWGDIY